ncbi:hypothetical protein BD410DRAFT_354974 [Rickenella mellea]|uniref:Uncharacterized protein n=1 Tax=Rickenella mellea TaxID=50990 RepID=A0A4Y7Q0D2_9AGAM|nr:hypothetical protein BD410DRAFT_354974 [Rickenella mellea]
MDYLEDVANLLAILRSRGWDAAFAEDVSYGVSHRTGHSDQHRSSLYDEPLLSLRQLLEDSKRCMSTLTKITESLGRKMRRLEKRTMPLVLADGIRRLPDELLANIFTLGHLSTTKQDSDVSTIGGDYALRGVSHVSHRFRQVSLKTPILWSRLSVLYPDSKMQAFLSRSGQVDLEIDTYHPYISNFKNKLKTLGAFSHRWSRLLILDRGTERVMQKLGLTKFPRLRHLYHEHRIASTTWQMPLLSHIECSSCHFGPGAPFLAQLATFEVSLDRMDPVNLDELAQALHNMSNLRKLSVQMIKLYSDCMLSSASGIFERHYANRRVDYSDRKARKG